MKKRRGETQKRGTTVVITPRFAQASTSSRGCIVSHLFSQRYQRPHPYLNSVLGIKEQIIRDYRLKGLNA